MSIACSCGCGTTLDAADGGLEVTIPASARAKAILQGMDETIVTMKLDANAEEQLIALFKARFRDRV